MLQVPPALVKRCKTHYHNLPCGATVILGNNGYIWIGPPMTPESDLSLRGSEKRKEVNQSPTAITVKIKCVGI